MNLLQETLKVLEANDRKIGEIKFIGSLESAYSCSWKEFEKLADREYDAGYGSQEVADDLVIVFKDNALMHRFEYDGMEYWVYQPAIKIPWKTKPIKTLFVVDWHYNLQDIHEFLE